MDRFKNKIVLITGAAKGIGLNILKSFVKEGAILICFDLEKINEEELQNDLNEFKDQINCYKVDLNNSSQFFTLISEIEKTFGVIDILINNAAIKNKNNIFQEDLSSWDSAMNVMLKAPFFLSQLVL